LTNKDFNQAFVLGYLIGFFEREGKSINFKSEKELNDWRKTVNTAIPNLFELVAEKMGISENESLLEELLEQQLNHKIFKILKTRFK
jgi:hypothetical protein|tara:strand:- start:3 stop:263 length:261 start_codon:yes stop_codon:yes gene_type:complete